MKKKPSNYVDCIQGSHEWFQARCGCVTGSRVGEVIKTLKRGGYSKLREDYKMEKLTEILTGSAVDHFVTPEMAYGLENEPLARTAYELERSVEVELVGHYHHPRIKQSGASPDGLVGDDGLLSIKVPKTSTHLEYVLSKTVPEDYLAQCMWEMACTGRKWCDFLSYDPRLPQEIGLYIVRVHRDEKIIAAMEREVELFLAEVNALVVQLVPQWQESYA